MFRSAPFREIYPTQNGGSLNVHDKIKISTLISTMDKPQSKFILVEGSMAKQTKDKHVYWIIDYIDLDYGEKFC